MIKSFSLKNFTLFREAEMTLSPNLNVIIGENGCGKSHLLKALYSLVSVSAEQGKKMTGSYSDEIKTIDFFIESIKNEYLSNLVQATEKDFEKQKLLEKALENERYKLLVDLKKNRERLIESNFLANKPTKTFLEKSWAEKLNNVLRPEKLGNLTSRYMGGDDGRRTELLIINDDEQTNIGISFSSASQSEVKVESIPQRWVAEKPIFFPTRELLTLYPGFISTYDNHYLEFEETYRDTCLLLGLPALKGVREVHAKELLKPIEEAMGGEVILDSNGRFYLQQGKKRIEMPLVAEGLRKFAMLARLIATGSLLDKGYLFWDEPEANLNPKLIKTLAKVILDLCKQGIQVFIATHSLFLLRELEILQKDEKYDSLLQCYFGLNITSHGVEVESGKEISDLRTIVMLEEELMQTDRYMESC
ncbi:AAA family ATPase [Aeromonas veronii]|uniref:AAA family ATPase n=1 Tax=Aeromonas veronii TaxID=654 RepID=UPI003F74A640